MHAVQEYLGSYVADEQGRLVFREGALVTAVRQGHWVVLDELNLAPSEVLEALNRRAVPLALALQLPLKLSLPTHRCHGSLWSRSSALSTDLGAIYLAELGFRSAAHPCAVCSTEQVSDAQHTSAHPSAPHPHRSTGSASCRQSGSNVMRTAPYLSR